MLKTLFVKYREMILYLFFGVLTTLVNWAAYWLLTDLLHVHYMASTVVSQLLAILFAYVTNRTWVFESKVHGARGVSLLLDMGCMFVGVDLLHMNDKVMKVFASVLIVIANYIFSKLFVFRGKPAEHKDGRL